MDLQEWIADERRGVADLVDTLSPEQLAQPSLCTAWTVHDVAAHLLMPLVTPVSKVVVAMARSGFSFDRANLRLTAAVARSRTPAQIATELRERATTPFTPPGMGFEGPLNDLLVHQQDIRRPLGLPSSLAPERVRACLDFRARVRLARAGEGSPWHGVRFGADDVGWAWGSGPLAHGTGEALLLVLNGRRVALADLTGPGADLLRGRAG